MNYPQARISEDTEVRGEVLLAILDGLRGLEVEALQILGRHGISQPEASRWYSLSGLLAAWEELGQRLSPGTLYAMGRKLAAQKSLDALPISGFDDLIHSFDRVYQHYHRGGDAGHGAATRESPRAARFVLATPYPCEFERGVLLGLARRWPPAGAGELEVEHDEAAPCRRQGQGSCTYRIRW